MRRKIDRRDDDAKEKDHVAILMDITKAYPRVNKPLMWQILRKLSMGENMLRTIEGLHETTEYMVKGFDDLSSK